MAFPAPTNRGTPSGIKLLDGFSTKVTFKNDPTIELWEKDVQPPGADGGQAIDTSTMHNIAWKTFHPRSLKTLTEMSFDAAYDPEVYDSCVEQINVVQEITVTFPDLSQMAFWGFLMKFTPQNLQEGNFPMAKVTIVPTNEDPNDHTEYPYALVSTANT